MSKRLETYKARAAAVIDIRNYPLKMVKGNCRNDDGTIGAHRSIPVYVSPVGKAWNADTGIEYRAERWGDGDYFDATTNGFVLDSGEFERCGIAFQVCGSAV